MAHQELRAEAKNETSSYDDDSPIEQVRLTVPVTDNPTLPVITFRTWVLGSIFCIVQAFVQQYISFRQNVPDIPSEVSKFLLLPLGRLMAATLPTKVLRVPGTKLTFSMNPGPFNIKEHVLINVFAASAVGPPHGVGLLMTSKIFFKKDISILLAILLTITTEMSGYGFAGIFMKFLVDSPLMWWPNCLVEVASFRALHDKGSRQKGHLTRLQFLLIAVISSFAYSIIPNYFFPSIGALSVVCWVSKDSILAQQIGSGRFGLGIGSFAFDWDVIINSLGNPLSIPMFALVNSFIGFIFFLYILTPIAYWSNTFNAKRFPFSSYDLLDFDGQIYNVSRVLNKTDLTLNQKEYGDYSKIYMSTMTISSYGFTFAFIAAVMTNFFLFHGREVWCQFKRSYKGTNQFGDVHNRLMKKYNSIPQWWFYVILVSMIGLAVYISEGFGKQTQLPYWGVLLAYLMAFILTLPLGVIQATTGQSFGLHTLSDMVIGYLYPGKPLAAAIFQAYGISTVGHAHFFLSDFKLAYYMKIPPKAMFVIQIVGSIISAGTSLVTALWLISTVDNICDVKKLPVGSPWTCPYYRMSFSGNLIWGLVGPSRVFAPHGLYSGLYYFFAIGAIASFVAWILSRCLFPKTKWLSLVNVPVILGTPAALPVTGAVSYWSAFAVAIFFNYFVYRKHNGWWAKYNYILASALSTGAAFMVLFTSVTLTTKGIYGVKWWGLEVSDHCPLAQCPTAPGVEVQGCPLVH